ncbi:MAG TPA: hypothetical protein DF409_08045 [Bacteroidales bacterium]|nr:hypothetical protein [Bacteroidales bacterium]
MNKIPFHFFQTKINQKSNTDPTFSNKNYRIGLRYQAANVGEFDNLKKNGKIFSKKLSPG